jgi:hypothetical protein
MVRSADRHDPADCLEGFFLPSPVRVGKNSLNWYRAIQDKHIAYCPTARNRAWDRVDRRAANLERAVVTLWPSARR